MYLWRVNLTNPWYVQNLHTPKKYGRRVGLSQIQNIAYYNFDVMVKVVVNLINQDNQ